MTFSQAVQEIEGYAFSARVNVASDFRTFRRAVGAEKAASELARLIQDREVANTLLYRAVHLVCEHADFRYEHPRDAAIATYILLLSPRYIEFAKIVSESAVLMSQSWWSREAAESILTERDFAAQTDSQETEMLLPGVPVSYRAVSATIHREEEQQIIANYLCGFIVNTSAQIIVSTLGQMTPLEEDVSRTEVSWGAGRATLSISTDNPASHSIAGQL